MLQSNKQIKERHKIINEKQIKDYEVKKYFFDIEEKESKLNTLFERKFVKFICKAHPDLLPQNQVMQDIEFNTIHSHLNEALLKSNIINVLKSELSVFVKVR